MKSKSAIKWHTANEHLTVNEIDKQQYNIETICPSWVIKFCKYYIENTVLLTLTGKTLRYCKLSLHLEKCVRFCPLHGLDRVW